MASAAPQSSNRRTGLDRRAWADKAVAADLAAAIEKDELEVLFQPIYAAADGRVIGAEALARWRRGQAGTVGGEKLFALARRAGRVSEVSLYLARSALVAASRWASPLGLSLNVTADDLEADDFCERILGLLVETSVSPQRLTLEITEQSLVADIEEATRKLDDLARLGVRIALDDFGAGFCHFGYLKRLPLDALKLDRSMVEDVAEQPRDLAVLRGIVAMAKALRLEVVAEGIESEAQRVMIVREGCDAWQGFLGAGPMTAAEFSSLAAR